MLNPTKLRERFFARRKAEELTHEQLWEAFVADVLDGAAGEEDAILDRLVEFGRPLEALEAAAALLAERRRLTPLVESEPEVREQLSLWNQRLANEAKAHELAKRRYQEFVAEHTQTTANLLTQLAQIAAAKSKFASRPPAAVKAQQEQLDQQIQRLAIQASDWRGWLMTTQGEFHHRGNDRVQKTIAGERAGLAGEISKIEEIPHPRRTPEKNEALAGAERRWKELPSREAAARKVLAGLEAELTDLQTQRNATNAAAVTGA